MFKWFKKVVNNVTLQEATFQKVSATFITVDGETHISNDYNWGRSSGLLCSLDEYIMISVKSDGYIKSDGVMYVLKNIISIKWTLVDEFSLLIPDKSFSPIFYTQKEIDEIKNKQEKYL